MFRDSPSPEQVIASAVDAFREEYEEVDVYPSDERLGDRPGIANDVDFVCFELINSAYLRAFQTDRFTVLVLYQGFDGELAETRPLLEAISASLTLDGEAPRDVASASKPFAYQAARIRRHVLDDTGPLRRGHARNDLFEQLCDPLMRGMNIIDRNNVGRPKRGITSMDAKIDSHQVESIGAVAGQVWQYLDVHGSVTLSKLAREIEAPRDLVMQGVGWLAREGKIAFHEGPRSKTISLI